MRMNGSSSSRTAVFDPHSFDHIHVRSCECSDARNANNNIKFSPLASWMLAIKVMPLPSIEKTWKWRFSFNWKFSTISTQWRRLVVGGGGGFMNYSRARFKIFIHTVRYSNTHSKLRLVEISISLINFPPRNFLPFLRQTLFHSHSVLSVCTFRHCDTRDERKSFPIFAIFPSLTSGVDF